MTDKQSEALRLADALDLYLSAEWVHGITLKHISDELRRLHEVNAELVEALEKHVLEYETAEALRARLAQPEPEPVAWHEPGAYGNVTVHEKWANENGWLPLYTAPPQRERGAP